MNFMKGIQIIINLIWIHEHLANGYEFSQFTFGHARFHPLY
jgi:hypothetical protein